MPRQHEHTPDPHEVPDPWHVHTPDEGLPQTEHAPKVNIKALTVMFFAVAVFLVTTLIATYMYFARYVNDLRRTEMESTVNAEPFWRQREAIEGTRAVRGPGAQDPIEGLHETYSWASATEGRVAIPVEVAKERVIRRYAGK